MPATSIAPPDKLSRIGFGSSKKVHYQCSPDKLVGDTLRLNEGILNHSGALVIKTGEFTGRSPKDRYIVTDPIAVQHIYWNDFNIPIEEEKFFNICNSMQKYLSGLPELWVRDAFACADLRYRLKLRIIAEKPWSSLFAYNMFIRPDETELENFQPEWQLFAAPGLKLDPETCGTRKGTAVVINFQHKMIIVAGTGYTGEIKKAVFTVLNYLLPLGQSVLSMHCAANRGKNGDAALFFGLSGTGKTTLSADRRRQLIGDDEHGWTNDSIFNFEGGCYAKVINLSEELEPEIFSAIRSGALLENTVFFPGTNKTDYSSAAITENTRVSYPIDYISNAVVPSVGNIPSNIFFLTCDAYGVLPPVSLLTPEQAMYHFLSGYTAKIAGTEAGITEPVSTFSACFGAPFLPLHPGVYAKMLGEKIKNQKVNVWLINTGWTGGPYGIGERIKLIYTRSMISAVLEGKLNKVNYDRHPVFGIHIPVNCPGVPSVMLYPRDTWKNKEAYDQQAALLADKFIKNFAKYSEGVSDDVRNAGPISTP